MQSTIVDIIKEIKDGLDPNREGLSILDQRTFVKLVSKAVDKVTDNERLTALSLCYSKAMHDGDSDYFRSEIDKILNPK